MLGSYTDSSFTTGKPGLKAFDTSSASHVVEFDDVSLTCLLFYVDLHGSCGGYTPCYTSIQGAINAAASIASMAEIRIAQGTYTEVFSLNESKSLTLKGGWDSSFSSQTSNTTFIKAPSAPKNPYAANGHYNTLRQTPFAVPNVPEKQKESRALRDRGSV